MSQLGQTETKSASRGDVYNNKHEYDRAIADYTKAIEIDPKEAYVYTSRGAAYWDKGEYDRAIADSSVGICVFRIELNRLAVVGRTAPLSQRG